MHLLQSVVSLLESLLLSSHGTGKGEGGSIKIPPPFFLSSS